MRLKILGTRQAPSSFLELFQSRSRGLSPQPIKRIERPYWQERGWVRQGDRYLGNYQTRYGSFRGMIEQPGTNHFRFYIFDPPKELKRHSHWVCFQYRGANGYQAHMRKRPADVSSGIITIERLITEAFQE